MDHNKHPIIEFAPFTLAEGVDEAALTAAADALQREFLSQQAGFIHRDLVRMAERKWGDIIYWASQESVEHAMPKAMSSPAALKYFELMVKPEDGDSSGEMLLMSIAKSYSK